MVVFWFADCFKWIVYEPMKWSQASSVNIHSNTFLNFDSNDQKYSDNKNQAAVAPVSHHILNLAQAADWLSLYFLIELEVIISKIDNFFWGFL